jgi:hypothetical protein
LADYQYLAFSKRYQKLSESVYSFKKKAGLLRVFCAFNWRHF